MNPSPFESCPAPRRLGQLAGGDLPRHLEAGLIQHLDGCPRCRQILDAQHDSDPLAQALQSRPGQRNEDSQALRAALDQLRPPTPQADAAASGQVLYADVLPRLEAADGEDLARVAGYHLTEYLGRGGMGVVFKARDPGLDRMVAIKVLSPDMMADEVARQRFLREARAGAALSHPNVVTIHAVSETAGLPFLVTEYVSAGTLAQHLSRCGPLRSDQVAQFGRQIAAGLAAAHEHGIIHRDVKPDNILLETPSGPAKIADFGLARAVDDAKLTQSGLLVGTPAYLAPEAVSESGQLDHRADLFSLGSVLYTMCTGHPPFAGDSVFAILHSVVAAHPPPIQQSNPDVPEWLIHIIRKLHAKDPAQRYQSAADVERHLSDRVRPRISPARWTRRRQYAVVGLAVTMLLAAMLGYVLVSSSPRTERALLEAETLTVGTEDDLEEILAEAESGAVIELRHDGPFSLPEVQLGRRSLTVVAAEGTRPVLHFHPEDEEEESDGQAMLYSTGDLTLEGLVLRYVRDEEDDEEGHRLLVRCRGGTVRATRCRLVAEPEGGCLSAEGASRVELRDCELHAGAGTAVAWEPPPDGSMTLGNCLLTGAIAVEASGSDRAVLRCAHSTILAEYVLFLFDDEPTLDTSLRVDATANSFDAEGSLLCIEGDDPAPLRLARWVDWRGRHNVYTGDFVVYGDEEDPQEDWGAEDWNEWLQQTVEVGSAVWEARYALERERLWELLEQPSRLRPRYFRIPAEGVPDEAREETPGADPETIGPRSERH